MESYNVAARPIFGSIQPISLKLQLGLYQARCGNQPFRLEMPSCDIAHRPFDDEFPVRREMGIVPIPVLLDVVKVRPRFACPKHRNAFVGSRRRNSLRDGSWDIAQLRRVFGALQRTVGTERRTELLARYGSGPSAPWVATSPSTSHLAWRRGGVLGRKS